MYNFHLNEKNDTSLKIDPICIFLTIDFSENLQEYFLFGIQRHKKLPVKLIF